MSEAHNFADYSVVCVYSPSAVHSFLALQSPSLRGVKVGPYTTSDTVTSILVMHELSPSAVGVITGIISDTVDLAWDRSSQDAAILASASTSETF